jgi:hypothetical protein
MPSNQPARARPQARKSPASTLSSTGPSRATWSTPCSTAAILEEYDPQSVRERILIDEVAACCWRIRRLLRYECRETWADDDAYHRDATTESPTEEIASTLGYDYQGARERVFRKFRRAGLHTFVMPADVDVDRIVRYERLIKRNLYRALYTLERIRAARQSPESSAAAPLPEPLGRGGDLLDKNKF